MFYNFSRISALNVLSKTFLNIIESIWCAIAICHLLKPNGSTNTLYWRNQLLPWLPWPGKKNAGPQVTGTLSRKPPMSQNDPLDGTHLQQLEELKFQNFSGKACPRTPLKALCLRHLHSLSFKQSLFGPDS